MTFDEPDGATPLDPDEIQGLKFPHVTTRGELDELEQANIEQGLAWVSRRRGGSVLDDNFIRTLHKRLFGDVWTWAGEYRLTEKNIGIDPFQIPVQLRMHLNDARYWAAHHVYPPLEAAARFHHRMVQIHPFPNGNGRHARIAADILLEEIYGQPPISWASGFDLQADNERRDAYIKALRAADGGDIGPLLVFVGAVSA
ncbi:mobile mystery protein B [Nisaea sp.]|uniref:mobile mystery protein B n=1 Tax=Nisaea sp. TaxID=2024842 RepID=UPI0032ED28BD